MINTTQKDTLNIQTNTENQTKSNYSTTNEPIENTPFRLVGNEQQGYAICAANYRLTKTEKTKELTIKKLEIEPYTITANLITVMLNMYDKGLEEILKNYQKTL